MRRVGVSSTVFPSGQGFQLRWMYTATQHHSPDNCWTFYWGGANIPGGGGEFAATFTGDGIARLFMRIPVSGVLTWVQADNIRYSPPNEVMSKAHTFAIQPYRSPGLNGYYPLIEFRTSAPEEHEAFGTKKLLLVQPQYSARRTLFDPLDPPLFSPQQKQFMRNNAPFYPTGPGVCRIDIRQDLALELQVATMDYDTTSRGLTDGAVHVDVAMSGRAPLHLSWSATLPPGCTVTGHLLDADTGNEPTIIGSTPMTKDYTPVPGQQQYHVLFDLQSSGTSTPILWSWRAQKAAVVDTAAPSGAGVQAPVHTLMKMEITGPTGEPSHESANVVIEDRFGALASPLDVRSEVAYRIETTDPLNFPGKNVVLSAGYVTEGRGHRVGHDTNASGLLNWKERHLTCLGMWKRLAEQLYLAKTPLILEDPTTQNVNTLKITDAIRLSLYWAGFPPPMVDVPDSYLRFWPTDDHTKLTLQPFANFAETIIAWAKNYLGWFLTFDYNAGAIDGTTGRPTGMWRLKIPPQYGGIVSGPINATPRYTFTTEAASGHVAIQYPGSYPPFTTFVRDDTLDEWIIAPEGNICSVWGSSANTAHKAGYAVRSDAYNLKSATFFNAQVPAADPTNADWLGRAVIVPITDAAIIGQSAANYVCRRTFDLACHARKMKSFVASLVFVNDSGSTITVDPGETGYGPFSTAPAYATGQPRPLTYYDLVQFVSPVESTLCFVMGNSPDYDFDGDQTSFYELMVAPANYYLPGIYLDPPDY